MKYYINQSTDPRYNLALEEYVFENAEDDIFMLWRNSKSVIIGKNQNAYGEVDLEYTRKNGIAVVRRITGGGAVFHDTGNINYTFISPLSSDEKDFKYFSAPIVSALEKMGVKLSFSGRNDLITQDGFKVSGTARCEKNGRVLHHGTLLYSADMSCLSSALKVNPEKMKSKGIKSVKSRVVNISNLLETKYTPEEFMENIRQFVVKTYSDSSPLILTDCDLQNIEKLTNEKYATDNWNLSSNLPFEKISDKYFDFGLVTACYTVKNGVISNIAFKGDFFEKKELSELENILCGVNYNKDDIEKALSQINVSDFICGATAENIINLICN